MKVAESLKQLNNGEAKGEFNDGLIEVAEEYGLDLARTLTNGVHGFRCSFFLYTNQKSSTGTFRNPWIYSKSLLHHQGNYTQCFSMMTKLQESNLFLLPFYYPLYLVRKFYLYWAIILSQQSLYYIGFYVNNCLI